MSFPSEKDALRLIGALADDLAHPVPVFEPTEAMGIVATYPEGRVEPKLSKFFHDAGVPAVAYHNVRNIVLAYNRAVRDIALPSTFDWFIFADHDLRPDGCTDPFWTAAGDIVGCMYPTANDASWADPSTFHTGLWRCHRGVLDAIQPPWFGEEYSPDGCDVVRCTCNWFRDKAVAKNFRITVAGWADHTVTGKGGT